MNSDIMRLLTGRSRCKLIAGAMTLVLAAFTAPQIVLSNTESCRAQLDVRPSGGGRYALIAYSAIPGTLSGYLFFDTKAGWYRAVLNGVDLQPSTVTFPGTRSSIGRFRSPMYVLDIGTPDVLNFAVFSEDGTTMCAPVKPTADPKWFWLWTLLDSERERQPEVLKAASVSAPGRTDCAIPFREASASDAIPPIPSPIELQNGDDWGRPLYTIIDVVIEGDGSLRDARIGSSSGNSAFDADSLRAARLSKYEGGRSFCSPVGGHYLLRAEFNPD